MPAQTPAKPYDRLGPFVLFRKLDADPLGETWRAGLLEPPSMGPVLATRKLVGNRDAWAACFPSAKLFAEKIGGTTIAKAQKFEFADGQPVMAWEYAGGRSLAHIAAAAAAAHNPIPTDQAIAIAEKVAVALEAINNVKQEGKRLVHGALIPQFVWISEDGDVRIAGQLLGKALLGSLSDPAVAREAGPYVAPELRGGGEPTKASDIYAAGAILYLAVTGEAPPDSKSGKVIDAVHAAKLPQGGEPLPADIKAVLLKALATDPAARYDGPSDLHKALSELLGKGQYAPTTFNLAFYLHNLLRTEMEAEQKEREREAKIDVKGYLEDLARPAAAPAPQPPPKPVPPPAPMFGTATFDQPKKTGSKMPLVLGAVVVALAGAGAWFVLGKKEAAPAQVAQAAPAAVTQTVPAAPVAAAPVVAALPGQETETAAATGTDAEARKKAIEDEISRRVAAEMAKVQSEYNKELLKQQEAAARASGAQSGGGATAKAPATAQPAQQPPAAAQPAQPAPTTATQAPAAAPPTATQAPAPEVAAAQPAPAPAQQQPPAPRVVETGDFVASTELDQTPKAVRRVTPVYPPMAARQRLSGTVILGLLINENGRVQDARVLSVDKKGMGFEDAAVTAAKQFTYEPGIKDGKKVKTLIPVPFAFGK